MQTDFSRFSYSASIVWFRDRINKNSKFCACAKIGILFLWTWGAFHLLRNSENSSWDVDGTHVFRTFHWKVPGNNWIFKKGSPSCFPFGNFRWKSMFHLRVFTRNHRPFQAIHSDICATIMNIGDKSITNGACVKWKTFFARWTFPWEFPKVFGNGKTPRDTCQCGQQTLDSCPTKRFSKKANLANASICVQY